MSASTIDPDRFREFEQTAHDRIADSYHAFFVPITEHAAEPLLDAAGIRAGMRILDIATGEIRAPQRTVVKKYKGEPESGNLETTEVTITEIDPDALKNEERFRQDRVRPDHQSLNRGLFFVPR